jgi:hypothetical protein
MSYSSDAQNKKFIASMKKSILLMDSAKTATDYYKAARSFGKTGERKNWLVNYYMGMCYVFVSMENPEEYVDKWCDTAEVFINVADSLSPNNSEVYVLKALWASAKIMDDPRSRAFIYGKKSYDFTQKAMDLNPDNPRSYVSKAQGFYYTPDAFGGGCVKAKPMAEKALEKFKIFKPASEIHPRWGKELAEKIIVDCGLENK